MNNIEIYDKYCLECLDNDGDYLMSFIDWLNLNDYQIIRN